MPCYCEDPKESQVIFDRIMMKFLHSDEEVKKTVFKDIKELVLAYVKMHAERNRMGNILCDLGKQIKENASNDIWPCEDFFVWFDEHQKRDKEGEKLPPPESLFSFHPAYIKMGE